MITFMNVSKSFRSNGHRNVILHRASFEIRNGDSLGILIPSGQGKTTLINMIAGLERPDEGEVMRTCAVSRPFGIMPGLVPFHSASENCRHLANLYGLDPDYVEAFCLWLTQAGNLFYQPMRTLSQDMCTKIKISLLLSIDSDVYLVDEGVPRSKDSNFNRRAGQILREKIDRKTLVIVSHEPNVLLHFTRSIAMLEQGNLRFFESTQEASEVFFQAA